MEENPGGNTPPDNQEGSNVPEGQPPENKAPDQNPLFPKGAGDVPTGQEPEGEEVDPRISEIRNDPDYQRFMKDAGTPEIAYKRWRDSSKEAKRLTDIQETLSKDQRTLEAVKRDFDIMRDADPETYQKVVNLFQKLERGETPQSTTPTEEPMSEERVRLIAETQTMLSEFRNDYKSTIQDNDDLMRIRKFAASLAGKTDRDGNPFTYRQALVAGLQYYHPEVVGDQAKMEAMADLEQRNSASELGNAPSGSTPKTRALPLTPEEKMVASRFGMTDEEYRKYQTEEDRKAILGR